MITLGLRDLSASAESYDRGLGLPRMESPPEFAFFIFLNDVAPAEKV
jgi:uncharacterized protein